MSHTIFLSYAHQDDEYAARVREMLPSLGIASDGAVIVDPTENVAQGANLREAITKQIDDSSTVVVIMTDRAMNSSWVNYEIGVADALDKPVVVLGRPGSGKSAVVREILGRLRNARAVEVDVEHPRQ